MFKRVFYTLSAVTVSLALLAGCKGPTVPVNTPTSDASSSSMTASSVATVSGEATAPVASPSSTVSAGIAGSVNSDQYIGEETAKNVALQDAGLTESDTQWLYQRLDYENGRAVYDVEFCTTSQEYDYEIDAITGEILAMDYDASYRPGQNAAANGSANGNGNGYGAGAGANANTGDYITEDAARSAALAHAGLSEADVTFVRSKFDWDDGRAVYDVEFYSGSTEYDYEIDATTGAVLSFDADAEYWSGNNVGNQNRGQSSNQTGSQNAGTNASGMITADEAKAIALAHAGVSEADTSYLTVHLDRDDGHNVYEVEWRIGWTEYNYEVRASDGSVLSFEVGD